MLKEEWGGGERSRNVKSREMNLESTTQKLGFSWNSIRTWIRDSSVRRKKPRWEASSGEREEREERDVKTE